jgi:uncharacterized protein (DUF2267 family)
MMSEYIRAQINTSEANAERHAEFLEFKRQKAEQQLVDRREAAELLGVTLRTFRRWHEENRGPPAVRFRRQRFYALPDILEHLNAKERRRNKRSKKKEMTFAATSLEPPPQGGLLSK